MIKRRVFSSINSGDFDSITEAIAATPNGGILNITEDINLTEPLSIDKNIVIDLNEKTISSNSTAILVDGGSNVTLRNGTINATGGQVARVIGDSTLTIESGDYSSNDVAFWAGSGNGTEIGHIIVNDGNVTAQEFALGVLGNGSTLEVNGGTFTANDNAVIGGNGIAINSGTDIIINGGTFNGKITTPNYIACGIYQPQDGALTLNGGTFNIEGGVGVLVRAGQVDINDGVVINTTGTTSGWVGDKKSNISCNPIYIDGAANYPAWQASESMTTVNGGTFTTESDKILVASAPSGKNPQDFVTINNSAIAAEDIEYL